MSNTPPERTYWLKRTAEPFVDSTTHPTEVITDPAEINRFPNEATSCGRCGDIKASCACGNLK